MGWFSDWRAGRRRENATDSLDKIRRFLGAEKKGMPQIEAVVTKMEVLINQGNFDEADRYIGYLFQHMQQKGILDKAEVKQLKRLKRIMLKEFKAKLRKAKKAAA